MTLNHNQFKQTRARELGYDSYDTAIICLYLLEDLSYKQTADYFGQTHFSIKARFRTLGFYFEPKPRGGANNKRKRK